MSEFSFIYLHFLFSSRLVLTGLDETWLKDYKQKIMINGNVPTWLGSGESGSKIHNSLV